MTKQSQVAVISDNSSVNATANATTKKVDEVTTMKQAQVVEITIEKATSNKPVTSNRKKANKNSELATKKPPVGSYRHDVTTATQGIEIAGFINQAEVKGMLKTLQLSNLSTISTLCTITKPGLNHFGRPGTTKFESNQAVSTIVDNWVYSVCVDKGNITSNYLFSLVKKVFNAVNTSARCGHLDNFGQIEATFIQIAQSLQAHRPESLNNSVDKLVKLGYTNTQAKQILTITNQVSKAVRPIFMMAKNAVNKAAKQAEKAE